MKNVMVTLLAQKPNELSRFLKSFYHKEIIHEEGAYSWSCYFESPKETLNLLSTLMDNQEDYQIELLLSLGKYAAIKVTSDNIEDIMKLFVWI